MQHLYLYYSPEIYGSFLSDAKQMTRFKLYIHSEEIDLYLSNSYPQLQSFSLVQDEGNRVDRDIVLVDFFRRHPNLVDLEFCNGDLELLSSIGEFQWLRKLSIDSEYCDYKPIAQLANLTTLKLYDNGQLMRVLQTSKSTKSLEEFEYIYCVSVSKVKLLLTALPRFTNLARLPFRIYGNLDDELLADLHRFEKLRALSFGGRGDMSITSNGLIGLVRKLHHLKQLTLFCESWTDLKKQIQLNESTLLRIWAIYENRNQKLLFSNYDVSKRMKENDRLAEVEHVECVHLDYAETTDAHIFFV